MAKFDREYDKWQGIQERVKNGNPRYDRSRTVEVYLKIGALVTGAAPEPRRNHTMKSENRYNGREEKRAKVRLMKQKRADREENQRRMDADENYGSW